MGSERKYRKRVACMVATFLLTTLLITTLDVDMIRTEGYNSPQYALTSQITAAMCMLPAVDVLLDFMVPRTRPMSIVELYQSWLLLSQLCSIFAIAYYAIPSMNWVVFNVMTSLGHIVAIPCIFYIFNDFAPEVWPDSIVDSIVAISYAATVSQIFCQKYAVCVTIHASLSGTILLLFYIGFCRTVMHHRKDIFKVYSGQVVATTPQILFAFYSAMVCSLYSLFIIVNLYPSPTDIIGTAILNSIFNLALAIMPRRLAAQEMALSEAALQNNRAFVKYISHEARAPLQIAVMGLQLYAKKLRALSYSSLKEAPRSDESGSNSDAITWSRESIVSRTEVPHFDTSDDQTEDKDAMTDRTSWYRSTRAKLEEIVVACRTSQSVLTNMLIYEKLQDGKLQVERERFDVLGFVDQCVHIFDIPATYRNVRIHSYHCQRYAGTPLEHAALFADRSKLQLAVRSFISNAMKFTPDGGDLAVNVWFLRRFSKLAAAQTMADDVSPTWNPTDASGGLSLDTDVHHYPDNMLDGDCAAGVTVNIAPEDPVKATSEMASPSRKAAEEPGTARGGHVVCRIEIQYSPTPSRIHTPCTDRSVSPGIPPAEVKDKMNWTLRQGDDHFELGSKFLKSRVFEDHDEISAEIPPERVRRGDGGVGLGLWLSKSSVELHGGVVGAVDMNSHVGSSGDEAASAYYSSALFMELPVCNLHVSPGVRTETGVMAAAANRLGLSHRRKSTV